MIRIQKYIADCGIMSRRAAERAIEEGIVTVNGVPAQIGQSIEPRRDKVCIRGRHIKQRRDFRYTYVLLNKPAGYVTTAKDELERRNVTELVKKVEARLFPVGRLDMHSEGLLILTNDGELTHKLTHPSFSSSKIYHVILRGNPTVEQIAQLSQPMVIDDYEIRPVGCRILEQTEGRTIIEMTLTEGRNRQIRKMCEIAGLEIRKLRRMAIVTPHLILELGKLRLGEWRYLTRDEIKLLKGNFDK